MNHEKDLHICLRIPVRYATFFKKIKAVRNQSWGVLFMECFKYHPDYNFLFTRSDLIGDRVRQKVISEEVETKEVLEIIEKSLKDKK